MVRVIWTRRAVDEIEAIRSYIEQFNPPAAQAMAVRLVELGESLNHFPHRVRPVERGRRELATVSPYVLRYRVERGEVVIERIRHGRRRPL